MVFFALIFVTAPVLVLSWMGVFVSEALKWLPTIAGVFLLIGVFGVIYTKVTIKKSLKDSSKEAELLSKMLESVHEEVNTQDKCVTKSQKLAGKLGLPADEEGLKTAYRKGYEELIAVQDAEVEKRFAGQKDVLDFYYAETISQSRRGSWTQSSAALEVIKPEMPGRHLVRSDVRERQDALGKYLKTMIFN